MDATKEAFKTEIFTGMDDADLNRKVWEWQTKNLVTIIASHPDELLDLDFKTPRRFSKIENFSDRWSRRVHYRQR
jgi:hypothetical protein